jgi:hypothetical protein
MDVSSHVIFLTDKNQAMRIMAWFKTKKVSLRNRVMTYGYPILWWIENGFTFCFA